MKFFFLRKYSVIAGAVISNLTYRCLPFFEKKKKFQALFTDYELDRLSCCQSSTPWNYCLGLIYDIKLLFSKPRLITNCEISYSFLVSDHSLRVSCKPGDHVVKHKDSLPKLFLQSLIDSNFSSLLLRLNIKMSFWFPRYSIGLNDRNASEKSRQWANCSCVYEFESSSPSSTLWSI